MSTLERVVLWLAAIGVAILLIMSFTDDDGGGEGLEARVSQLEEEVRTEIENIIIWADSMTTWANFLNDELTNGNVKVDASGVVIYPPPGTGGENPPKGGPCSVGC